jgi:hypothetical protein
VFKSWKQPLVVIQGEAAYIRLKLVGPFPGPCASRSYMHRAALYTGFGYIMMQIAEANLASLFSCS